LVEVNQKIPDRDEAELRLAVQGGEPSAASRVFDERPLRGAPLTPLPAREATGVAWHCKKDCKKMKTILTTPPTLYTATGFSRAGVGAQRLGGGAAFPSLMRRARKMFIKELDPPLSPPATMSGTSLNPLAERAFAVSITA